MIIVFQLNNHLLFSYLVLNSTIEGKKIWIGGNELATRNRWVWGSTGYRIGPYHNWAEGEPSFSHNAKSDAQCSLLDPEQDFQWISDSCGSIKDNMHYFFCEIYRDPNYKVCLDC